jgi:hypothetical protein
MNENMGLDLRPSGDVRETARDLIIRHGEHAEDYVRARIEASETAGESADAVEWRHVLEALSEGARQN